MNVVILVLKIFQSFQRIDTSIELELKDLKSN